MREHAGETKEQKLVRLKDYFDGIAEKHGEMAAKVTKCQNIDIIGMDAEEFLIDNFWQKQGVYRLNQESYIKHVYG